MAGSASRCQAKTKSPARTARPSDHSAFRSLKVQVTVPSAFSSVLTLLAAPFVTVVPPEPSPVFRIRFSYRWTRTVWSAVSVA